MKLTFLGAARQVAGSMYLLELPDEYTILIDCGLDLQYDRNKPDANKESDTADMVEPLFSFEPSQVNLVLLTHAHLDHSGNLPNLVKEGYEGKILCTSPTLELSKILLMDSARLHRKKIKSLQSIKKNSRRGRPAPNMAQSMRGLYLEKDVDKTCAQFVSIGYNQRFKIKQDIYVTYIQAGHLLGAAYLVLEILENGEWKKIGFSGDIGRNNYPLLPDPGVMPEVDHLICESTYGNRLHQNKQEPQDMLEDVIKRACIDIPGRLIVPAFSVGRTQALLYTLNKLYAAGNAEPIKVFSDSPLALQSTRIHEKFGSFLNQESQQFLRTKGELFDFENLHYVESLEESKTISNHHEPCIIISSSGMISGGRVEHHILANLQNPYCTILMIGFAAEGTLGSRLAGGQKEIMIGNKTIKVLANIEKTDVFSGHADMNGLMHFIRYQKTEKLKNLFLVHGDSEIMESFRLSLHELNYPQTQTPFKGQSFEL